jgi:acetylornithine/succinyldiaminopimelate/putrescine aminotransferase
LHSRATSREKSDLAFSHIRFAFTRADELFPEPIRQPQKGVRETGEYLMTQLRTLSRDLELGDVRGSGLLLALDLGREIGPKVVDAALAQGLLINSPRPTTLRFVPALNVTRAEIDQ